MYAVWARYGKTPSEVDDWPLEWSSGWLLERVLELEMALRHDPKLWDDGVPTGFGLDDPDVDPAFDAPAVAPPWIANLPFEGGE